MNTKDLTEEFRSYLSTPRFGGQYAVGVAAMLRNSAPADLDASEGAALTDIEAAARGVMEVLVERDRFSASRVRPYLSAYGAVWGAAGETLPALARIPTALYPNAGKAAMLAASLLPDGVAFVRLDAYAAWFEGKKRLDRIAAEGMTADLTAVVGAPLLGALTSATSALGDAIGVGSITRDFPSSTALAERVGEFGQTVATYTRLLIGKVNERQPATVERFRRAVAPIDEYRAARAQRGGGDDPVEVTPVVAPGLPGGSPFLPSTPAE